MATLLAKIGASLLLWALPAVWVCHKAEEDHEKNYGKGIGAPASPSWIPVVGSIAALAGLAAIVLLLVAATIAIWD